MRLRSIILFALAMGTFTSSFAEDWMVRGSGATPPPRYVPPLVSNGELSMLVDWNCGQRQTRYVTMTPAVYWAGRRMKAPEARLFSLGYFEWDVLINAHAFSDPESWTQELDVKQAIMRVQQNYTNGLRMTSEVLVPLNQTVIAFRRTVTNTCAQPQTITLALRYTFPQTPWCPGEWQRDTTNANVRYTYHMLGYKALHGTLILDAGQAAEPTITKTGARLASTVTLQPYETRTLTFFITYADAYDTPNYTPAFQQMRRDLLADGFEGVRRSHVNAWSNYLSEGSITIPHARLQRMYDTAQYHLRANATRWSFPVGIFPSHWHGRFFGWDEVFCHQGLITSGHAAIAQRMPDFRKATLPKATYRVAHYGAKGKFGAKYVWESLEDGVEGAPPGFWNDHIFHMSNIALASWSHYLFTSNRAYLRDVGYPVILECARYFRSHWVYENPDGSMYIGKCTDLERLGPARERTFQTTCGAIYTLRAAARAAATLGCDDEERRDFETVAEKLCASLPVKDGFYEPYPGCAEMSVATLAGLTPYPIFDGANTIQKNTAYRFIREGRKYGNMYPVGNAICPWYASKMAIATTLLEDNEEPIRLMTEAANTLGLFGELFEINEEKVVKCPWFATASGNCVFALNQILLCNFNDELRLAMGVPVAWQDYAFQLPAWHGLKLSARIEQGRLRTLRVVASATTTIKHQKILCREALVRGVTFDPRRVVRRDLPNGTCELIVTCSTSTENLIQP